MVVVSSPAPSANTANASTISAQITLCVVLAMCGLRYRTCVRPSADGSTFSRPSE